MKIIVTGGAGFIGSHFVDRLLALGHKVWVLDNLSSGSERNISPMAEFVLIDLKDEALGGTIAKIKPDAIFHLAAQIDVKISCADPIFDATENILASLKLIEAGLKNGMEFFCFASSGGAIYGEASGPQSEAHPESPINPYGVAKLAVDKYLHSYSVQRGLKGVAMRFSNVYGPRQGAKGEAGVVAVFAKLLRDGIAPRVNGDGLQTRDFVFVSDLAEAAANVLEKGATGIYNLGTGIETTILDLAKRLCNEANIDASHIQFGDAINGEQRRSVLDFSKASSEIGWAPATSLGSGLKITYDWFVANR
ncbi:MAG: NAD-dependent epimerase/dehydratase family protein [Holophagaceae bacterium]|nr:NAD-dependent epimerase/dehydratase family protein [Holophagaceae bacterium]